MNEKFNKNAKVEKFTTMLGIAVRLIVIFLCLQMFHLNFLEQLPLVEQYHAVNISSTRLDPERMIGQQLVSHDLFLILWRLLRYNKSTSSTELNSPNYSILFFPWYLSYFCADLMDTYNQC